MDMYYYSTHHYNHPEHSNNHTRELTKEQLEYLKQEEEDLEEFANIFDMEDAKIEELKKGMRLIEEM